MTSMVLTLIMNNVALVFLSIGLIIYVIGNKTQRINKGIVFGLVAMCLTLGVFMTLDDVINWHYNELLDEVWSSGSISSNEFMEIEEIEKPWLPIRYVTTAVGYVIRPATAMMLWLLIRTEKEHTFACIVPCVANGVLFITSYHTHLAFYFESYNGIFKFGHLYYICYVVAFFYIGLVLIEVVRRYQRHLFREFVFISFLAISYVGTAVLETFVEDSSANVLNIVIIGCVIFFYLMMQNEEMEEILNEKNKNLKDKENSLKLSQIQPHFIFNTLTSIIDLCPEGSEAQQALFTFARYLRANTDSFEEVQLVKFEEELEHVKIFIKLEKYSYGDRLEVSYNIEVTDFKIPPLSLQPLVENSVKYCFKKNETARISIGSTETNDSYIVYIDDDGPGFNGNFSNSDRKHIGIENIKYRLREMSNATLDYTKFYEIGTRAMITIPKEKKYADNDYR